MKLGLLEVLLDGRTDLIERRVFVRFDFDDVVAELRLHDRRHFADLCAEGGLLELRHHLAAAE